MAKLYNLRSLDASGDLVLQIVEITLGRAQWLVLWREQQQYSALLLQAPKFGAAS